MGSLVGGPGEQVTRSAAEAAACRETCCGPALRRGLLVNSTRLRERAKARGVKLNRNDVVVRWHTLHREILKRELDGATADELAPLRNERFDLGESYLDLLPRPAFSRCPFTDAVLSLPIDVVGIDGMWWAYYDAKRLFDDDIMRSFYSLQGAMRVELPVENTPFIVKPGPSVPYVVPRLLQEPRLKAVVSSLPVGRHMGFAITYFQESYVTLEPPDDWGRKGYQRLSSKGTWGWGERFENPETFDFDLAPWLTQGKLLWISPGDAGLVLRSTVDDCPYLGLEGERALQFVEDGRYWVSGPRGNP